MHVAVGLGFLGGVALFAFAFGWWLRRGSRRRADVRRIARLEAELAALAPPQVKSGGLWRR